MFDAASSLEQGWGLGWCKLRDVSVAILVGALALAGSACGWFGEPPPPTAETAALEGSLLTVADVGGGFVEEFRGEVGVSGGGVCPESDFGFDDVGMVRAAFVWPLEDDVQVELVQMVRVGEPGELDTMFAGMDEAFDACSGVVWTDYGETQVAEVVEAPEVGDDRLALHEVHGDPPFDGRHDDIRTVYVRSGDVFVEISVSETLDSSDDQPSLIDEEFERIVGLAVEKLN